ncbi:MAG: DNA repair protein RadC [Verrucomicrobiota bacterium]
MDKSPSNDPSAQDTEVPEFSCRIHDMPQCLRPREKLARLGPASLDNAELMALFISTGTKGRSAISIGRELLTKYGSMGALGGLPVAELAKTHGLGIAKASKLAAAFELGSRVAREELEQVSLETPERIYQYFGPQLAHLAQEHVVVAVLDTRLRHVSTTVVAVGTVNESNAHPREILRPVIARGGYGFVVIHNHPSGDASPSRADELATRRLIDAAELMQLRFLDHVIIGKPGNSRDAYYSFRQAGLIA